MTSFMHPAMSSPIIISLIYRNLKNSFIIFYCITVQCEKLYNDIIEAFETQKKHFTGTIVYIIGERNSSSLTEDLIIDGQQRITTILLLLKALLDIAIENNDSIKDELTYLLFNRYCDEEYKLKLKPVKSDDKQFQVLMQNNTELFNNDSHIIHNYYCFKKIINTLYDLDSSIMEKLAKSKYRLTSGNNIYISTTETDMKKPKEIENAGIFYETNLNAMSILSFVKALIDKYGIDTDEFQFQCRDLNKK